MTSNPYTPDEAELIGCYAASMEEHAGENYATAKSDAERGIAKIKADERQSLLEQVLELHTETVHGECAICFECTYDDGYEVDYSPFDYPCPTVQSVRSAIERSE